MTGIETSQVYASPSKGTPEGRRRRELEISKALEELKGHVMASEVQVKPRSVQKKGSGNAIWIESDEDEDGEEQLAKQLGRLSVEPQNKNSSRRPGKGKEHPDEQWPNSSSHWYETRTPISKATPAPPKYYSPAPFTPTPGLPEYSTPTATVVPRTPTRKPAPLTAPTRASTPTRTPSCMPSTPSRTSSVPPPPPPVPAMRGRQGSFNAYVVYSGRTPYFYADWSAVKRILREDQNLVFKGFYTLEKAKEAWFAASSSGVIAAIQNGAGRPYWSVTEGVKPAIYESVHEAVKVGLEWGGGCLKGWNYEADATEDWNDKARTYPSRIIETPSPTFFS